jgi:hypothetical protein
MTTSMRARLPSLRNGDQAKNRLLRSLQRSIITWTRRRKGKHPGNRTEGRKIKPGKTDQGIMAMTPAKRI